MKNKTKSILFDLFSSRAPHGRISSSKFWSNIGMAVMTANFIYMMLHNNLTEWYSWIYATVVVTPNLASKLLTLRWGGQINDEPPQSNRRNE